MAHHKGRKEPDPKKGFFERWPWVRDALLLPLVAGLLASGITLAIQLKADRDERQKEAAVHAAERAADEKAQQAHKAAAKLRNLEALVAELHNNSSICKTQLAIVDRNTELDYKNLAPMEFPTAFTRVFDSVVRIDDFDSLGDFQAFDWAYQNLVFVNDLIRSIEALRRYPTSASAGLIRTLESIINDEAQHCIGTEIPVLQAILRAEPYGIPAEFLDAQGAMPYWTHQRGAGSLMHMHGDSGPAVKLNTATGQVMLPSGQVISVPGIQAAGQVTHVP